MKIMFPDLFRPIEFKEGRFESLVVENAQLLRKIVSDLLTQIDGGAGSAVLSIDNSQISISKYADLTTSIVPFELNRKSLLNKILASMEKNATSPQLFARTQGLLADIERYISDLSFEEIGEVECDKLSVMSLLKAVGIRLYEERETTLEKLYNYMELVREYDRDKLFIFVNMRSFFGDLEMERFVETVISHKYKLLLIDGTCRMLLSGENRITIDEDLCEIG